MYTDLACLCATRRPLGSPWLTAPPPSFRPAHRRHTPRHARARDPFRSTDSGLKRHRFPPRPRAAPPTPLALPGHGARRARAPARALLRLAGEASHHRPPPAGPPPPAPPRPGGGGAPRAEGRIQGKARGAAAEEEGAGRGGRGGSRRNPFPTRAPDQPCASWGRGGARRRPAAPRRRAGAASAGRAARGGAARPPPTSHRLPTRSNPSSLTANAAARDEDAGLAPGRMLVRDGEPLAGRGRRHARRGGSRTRQEAGRGGVGAGRAGGGRRGAASAAPRRRRAGGRARRPAPRAGAGRGGRHGDWWVCGARSDRAEVRAQRV